LQFSQTRKRPLVALSFFWLMPQDRHDAALQEFEGERRRNCGNRPNNFRLLSVWLQRRCLTVKYGESRMWLKLMWLLEVFWFRGSSSYSQYPKRKRSGATKSCHRPAAHGVKNGQSVPANWIRTDANLYPWSRQSTRWSANNPTGKNLDLARDWHGDIGRRLVLAIPRGSLNGY